MSRRRPEGEEEAGIERVRDPAVEEGLAKLGLRSACAPAHVQPGLLKAEQLEMVDQEGADQNGRQPDPERDPDECPSHRVGDVPHDRGRSAARTRNRIISAMLAART